MCRLDTTCRLDTMQTPCDQRRPRVPRARVEWLCTGSLCPVADQAYQSADRTGASSTAADFLTLRNKSGVSRGIRDLRDLIRNQFRLLAGPRLRWKKNFQPKLRVLFAPFARTQFRQLASFDEF